MTGLDASISCAFVQILDRRSAYLLGLKDRQIAALYDRLRAVCAPWVFSWK